MVSGHLISRRQRAVYCMPIQKLTYFREPFNPPCHKKVFGLKHHSKFCITKNVTNLIPFLSFKTCCEVLLNWWAVFEGLLENKMHVQIMQLVLSPHHQIFTCINLLGFCLKSIIDGVPGTASVCFVSNECNSQDLRTDWWDLMKLNTVFYEWL